MQQVRKEKKARAPMLGVRLHPVYDAWLREKAEREDRSLASTIERMIRAEIEREEGRATKKSHSRQAVDHA